MKKSIPFSLLIVLCFVLTACSGSPNTVSNTPQTPQTPALSQPQETVDDTAPDVSEPKDETAAGNGVLIAYFSYGENAPLADGIDASTSASIQYQNDTLTGNTGLIAGIIADATGGELFSILTAEQYPDNYNDTIDVGQAEKSDNIRPELASHLDSLDGYDTVFLGFPNWWGDMPMAVYSFLDEYDFSGKTIAPFVTSGGSGFSGTIHAIENAEPDATILEGLSIRDSSSPQAEDDVHDWLAGLGLAG